MQYATLVVVAIFVIGCAPTAQPVPPTTPAPIVAAPPPESSDSTARAQALIDDLQRRQAAQAKFDREHPAPPPPRAEDLLRTQPVAAPSPTAPVVSPPPAAAQAPVAAAPVPTDARGEQWWKDQARALQIAIEDETAKMNQARAALLNSTLKITADEAEREYRSRVAAVQNARAALERLRDDARRAGVPPGWARWP